MPRLAIGGRALGGIMAINQRRSVTEVNPGLRSVPKNRHARRFGAPVPLIDAAQAAAGASVGAWLARGFRLARHGLAVAAAVPAGMLLTLPEVGVGAAAMIRGMPGWR